MRKGQEKVFYAIVDLGEEGNGNPTYEEIAKKAGTCKANAYRHVSNLEKQGLISREHNRARSIKLINESENNV